jgi:GT2 family glycosyltransferase/glycosyltransferase involved in cell wall biosynthesis
LARTALAAGLAAAASGDRGRAIAWLDRACRLAPADPSLELTLATHCLNVDPARAAALFAKAAERHDMREAWLGLAAARLLLGQSALAAEALHAALTRHAFLVTSGDLADRAAAAAGAPGWCALSAEGRLLVHPGHSRTLPTVSVDGVDILLRRPPPGRGLSLPQAAAGGRSIDVRIAGRELIGSPLSLAAIRRIEGIVSSRDGGLAGWAWHPGNPDRAPELWLLDAAGRRRAIRCQPVLDQPVPDAPPLSRPRPFAVSAAVLARLRGPFSVQGADAAELPGSPLDPAAERPEAAPPPARHPPLTVPRQRAIAIVVPVHGEAAVTLACLDHLLAHTGRNRPIVVVDDATPEPELAAVLDRLAARHRIHLIRHARTLGFSTSANAGIHAAGRRDIVLINSDVLVSPGWLDELRAAAYASPDIGTASALSNAATILGYPGPVDTNPAPSSKAAAHLAALALRANAGRVVDIPAGDGHCLYLRRDCLEATGPFREDILAKGPGAEVDFCLRGGASGWRHVAAAGVYVVQMSHGSSGAVHRSVLLRNQAVLNRLHPGRDAALASWTAGDPMAGIRRRLDEARWRADRPRRSARRPDGGSVLLVTHDHGGGVERRIQASCVDIAARGLRPIVLRPRRTTAGTVAVLLAEAESDRYPNLLYALPDEARLLAARLRAERPQRIELHHLLGHSPVLADLLRELGVPWEVHLHDYAWFCPRVALVGPRERYCGEPDRAGCEACIAEAGRQDEDDTPLPALLDRSARLLHGAASIVAPSQDAARRIRRHFPGVLPVVMPHEDDAVLQHPAPASRTTSRSRIVTVGAIGIEKGFQILLACARDAAHRGLDLEFVVVGHTINDALLLATDRVFVTGEFSGEETQDLIRRQCGSLGLLPSIWPETWCFALSDMWRAGLLVAAFDIGAPAERIRAAPQRGMLLPLGLPIQDINNTLLAAARRSSHE